MKNSQFSCHLLRRRSRSPCSLLCIRRLLMCWDCRSLGILGHRLIWCRIGIGNRSLYLSQRWRSLLGCNQSHTNLYLGGMPLLKSKTLDSEYYHSSSCHFRASFFPNGLLSIPQLLNSQTPDRRDYYIRSASSPLSELPGIWLGSCQHHQWISPPNTLIPANSGSIRTSGYQTQVHAKARGW